MNMECPVCGEVDPDKFYESTRKRMNEGHKLRPYCAECQREKARQNYRKRQDPVERLLDSREWMDADLSSDNAVWNIMQAILMAAVHIREGIDKKGDE